MQSRECSIHHIILPQNKQNRKSFDRFPCFICGVLLTLFCLYSSSAKSSLNFYQEFTSQNKKIKTNMQDRRSRGKLIFKRSYDGLTKCSDKAGQNLKPLQQFNLCLPSCAGLAVNFEKTG